MLQRRGADRRDEPGISAIVDAIAELRASGTGLVGDISQLAVDGGAARASALDGVVFHEVLRFAAADADAVLDRALRAQESSARPDAFP